MKLALWMTIGLALFVGMTGAALACDGCTTAKKSDSWCKSCNVGYFNDIKISTTALHAELKGSTAQPTCKSCQVAMKSDGTCKTCAVHFQNGVKYTSKFPRDLKKGVPPKTIKCKYCTAALSTDGFCKSCRVGYVAQRKYSSISSHIDALTAQARITDAGKKTCATCATAHLKDGSCKTCRLTYKDGVPTPMPLPAPKPKG